MEKLEGLILNLDLKDENDDKKVLTISKSLADEFTISIEIGEHKTELTRDKFRQVLQAFMF